MKPVIVIGAGLTGLACALRLHRLDRPVCLLDAGGEPGGNLRSRIVEANGGRWVLDLGPNSFGDGSEDMMRMIRDCGAEGELVPADEGASKNRFIFRKGRIMSVPAGPGLMFAPLLPVMDRLRMMKEPFVRPSRADQPEESLAEFADRRLGKMARLKLLTPVVSGIYAGDPEKLGAESAFPAMIELEREHGSLVRAAMKGNGPPQRGRLQTFREGLQTMGWRVAAALGEAYRPGVAVDALARSGEGWRVTLKNGEALEADEVVVATTAPATAAMLAAAAPELAAELQRIRYAPMAVVHVGVRREHAGDIPPGFGFLVPRNEGLRVLGSIFSSKLFSGRAPQGHELITIFTGGDLDPEAPSLSDEEIVSFVLDDLRTALGGEWRPALTEVTRWPQAIPQYVVGHKDTVARIEQMTGGLPGITLLGNWRGGIAMPNCAREGYEAAEAIAA